MRAFARSLEGFGLMLDESLRPGTSCLDTQLPYDTTYNACRHTHASRLLADGVPVTDVAKRLGHASPAVTMSIYAHAMPGQDEATARVVDQWSMARNLDDNLRG